MNKKVEAKLRLERGEFILTFQGKVIDIKHVGWCSENIDNIYEHSERKYNKLLEDDLHKILEEGGACYLETTEVRNRAAFWEGSAINSYTLEEPLYTEELALIDNKMIIHFYKEG